MTGRQLRRLAVGCGIVALLAAAAVVTTARAEARGDHDAAIVRHRPGLATLDARAPKHVVTIDTSHPPVLGALLLAAALGALAFAGMAPVGARTVPAPAGHGIRGSRGPPAPPA